MGQRLKEDKIGTLSQGGGSISLTASLLTIGGQQYQTSTLNRTIATDVTLTANSLYMIYAVVSGGVVSLRISSNLNSQGPAGFAAWKLVGAFYANGLVSVGFGSFVTIEGSPRTLNDIPNTPTFVGFNTTPTNQEILWKRDGSILTQFGFFTAGTPNASEMRISNPGGVTNVASTSLRIIGEYVRNNSAGSASSKGGFVIVSSSENYVNVTGDFIFSETEAGNWNTKAIGTAAFNSLTDDVSINYSVRVTNWSDTPLKDL